MAYWLVLSAPLPGTFVGLPDLSLDAAHNVVFGVNLILYRGLLCLLTVP
jgi:hypothetical protein